MLKSIEVQTTVLKEIFESNKIEKCDLMKIDIEGGEYPLLYDLEESIFSKIKLIAMECHKLDEKQNNPKKLIDFLQKKGFEIKKKRKSFGMLLILAENTNRLCRIPVRKHRNNAFILSKPLTVMIS
ncbi:MAG: hypothetical protein COT90_01190, partial [Candidatus Diapherotrites archaeon CG10_big_fil_rev_8_21_14_0_10_31_34]